MGERKVGERGAPEGEREVGPRRTEVGKGWRSLKGRERRLEMGGGGEGGWRGNTFPSSISNSHSPSTQPCPSRLVALLHLLPAPLSRHWRGNGGIEK